MRKNNIMFATAAGHIIEYFDSYLYGYFAFMLAPIFFPSNDPDTALIASFGAFAAGFIMRPLGGIFFGHLGDRLGRKRAFLVSILCIAVPTFGIGCLPSYNSIGIMAPFLLITFRLFQGISLGGEYGGAAIFIREHVERGRAGFAGSLLAAMGFVGALGGTAVGALFTIEAMPVWAWRIPFLLGGCFGLIVFFLRTRLTETPVFQEMQGHGNVLQFPFFSVIQKDYKSVISGIGIGMNTTIPYYLAIIYMNTHTQGKFQISTSATMLISTGLMVLWVAILPLAGHLADCVGRSHLMSVSALSSFIVALPAFYVMETTSSFAYFFLAQICVCLTSIPYVATCSSVLPILFPATERYSGSAFSYSLGVAVFGGTAPMIVSWLASHNLTYAPAVYLMGASLCGWLAVRRVNKEDETPLLLLEEEPSKKLAA